MRFIAAFLLAVMAGCSFDSAPAIELVDNRCARDADCPEGLCDGNICIDATNAAVEVAIEVIGEASATQSLIPTSWTFATEEFTGSNVRDLILPATREVRGTVRWEGDRVPATLRFVRRMPGSVANLQPVPIEVDTFRDSAGGAGSNAYDFRTVLVAGETYDVVVLPTSDMVTYQADVSAPALRSLPPLYLELAVETGEDAQPFRFDVSFPAGLTGACTASLKTGCTLEAEISSFDGEVELREAGLQVRAIQRDTGRVLSSVGETDESGRFAIRIGAASSDYLIRVTSGASSDLFPSVSIDPDVAFPDGTFDEVIRIPRPSPIQLTGRVQDEEGTGVPGAKVRLLSTGVFDEAQLGLQGSFTNSTTTNEDGSFGAQVLPGFYSISVTPPEESESIWGVTTDEALVNEDFAEIEPLVVPPKVELFGWVRTFRDEGAVGVPVSARARMSGETPAMHRSKEVVSNSQGAFMMRMDTGLYDMHVKVPSETGYAWFVEPALVMSQNEVRTYRLEPPIPVEGLVVSATGQPVPNALIRAYVLAGPQSEERPLQVAETISDQDGAYRLLIAPRLGDE